MIDELSNSVVSVSPKDESLELTGIAVSNLDAAEVAIGTDKSKITINKIVI
jgi:hypothetical protein